MEEFTMTENEIKALVRAEQARTLKEWRRKNPEKVKEANRRYWEKRALKRQAETAQNE